MKITNIEVFLTAATWRNFLFVKLTTDDGIVGWGYGTLEWKESTVRDLILDFGRRYVIGQNPFDIEDIWFKLYQIEHNTGPIMYAAMAGIETAMWDIVGKATGQPVYNLVGGKVRSRIKVYANGWYAFEGDLGKLKDRAREVVARGYSAMKFDPFGPGGREMDHAGLVRACKIVEAVRTVVGDEIELFLEFHGRFSPIMALEAMRAMQPYRPGWCEEPIPAHNHESMAQVVAAAPSRVATGEHTYSRFGFLDLLSRKAVHVIQPDLVYSGGFLETKKIAALAEAFYVSVAPHNCRGPLGTVIAIHLCANIPNFSILETFEDYDVPWRCDLTPGTPRVKNGYYELPAGPGWGVEVDESVISAHPENPNAKLDMFAIGWEETMCR
ncbi:MAG: mandelate racemase/muconate lactonizing enzyme family protein [Bryobacteraceae bacterium]